MFHNLENAGFFCRLMNMRYSIKNHRFWLKVNLIHVVNSISLTEQGWDFMGHTEQSVSAIERDASSLVYVSVVMQVSAVDLETQSYIISW